MDIRFDTRTGPAPQDIEELKAQFKIEQMARTCSTVKMFLYFVFFVQEPFAHTPQMMKGLYSDIQTKFDIGIQDASEVSFIDLHGFWFLISLIFCFFIPLGSTDRADVH